MTKVNVRNCEPCFWNTHLNLEGQMVIGQPGKYSAVCPLTQAVVTTTETSSDGP